MPVDSEMFHELTNVYQSYSKANDQTDFIKNNRKNIKILTDSLWEQILFSIFAATPRSYTDARLIINENIDKLEIAEDIAIANAMLAVLKEYDALIEKSYINITDKIKPILAISLRRLCLCLTQHRDHKNFGYAMTLQTLLTKKIL